MSDTKMTARRARVDLLGDTCRGCGKKKRSGMSHCRKCYLSLPRGMQRDLYKKIGEGYETAYADSLAWLAKAAEAVRASSAQGALL